MVEMQGRSVVVAHLEGDDLASPFADQLNGGLHQGAGDTPAPVGFCHSHVADDPPMRARCRAADGDIAYNLAAFHPDETREKLVEINTHPIEPPQKRPQAAHIPHLAQRSLPGAV